MRWNRFALAFGLFGITAANAAEIHVLTAQGIEQAYRELAEGFERASGHKITTVFTGILDADARLRAGETYDLLVMPAPSIAPYFANGTLVPGSKTDLAKSGTGFAVTAGAGKPDIGTVEAVKRALLAARSIGISSGPTGAYFAALITRLGIADRIKDKIKQTPSGVFVGEIVARGEAEIGFQQVGELSEFPGIDFIGPLPDALQNVTVFTSGITTNAMDAETANAFVKYMTTPEAAAVYEKRGMQRP